MITKQQHYENARLFLPTPYTISNQFFHLLGSASQAVL
jgi:hypothetical protein